MNIARRVARLLALAFLLAAGLVTRPVHMLAQASSELFFSEYIEGSSNNKALEIYNPTGAPVDLAAAGYSVQMYFNGSPTGAAPIALTGTVAGGGVFVLAHGSATAAILAQANQTNSASWYNGDDAVVLTRGGTIVDAIGQIGLDPGSEWGSGAASTQDNTIRRKPASCAGDANGADTFDPAVEWDGFPNDTFDGLGAHTANCDGPDAAPEVLETDPEDGAANVPVGNNLTVTFSEPVDVSGEWFTLVCSVSGANAATVSGGPNVFSIDPVSDFVPGESCTLTIVAANVADQDASDPPDQLAADYTVTFATVDVCAQPVTPIFSIQGSGASAAITGPVTTRGVVIGDYEGPTPALRGFFIQDAAGDGDAGTSDGIFVFNGNSDSVTLGQIVYVSGTASEFQGQTQITASSVSSCGTGSVEPVEVTLPVSAADALERYEGMLVTLPQTLYVTEHFQLGRFGQVVVSSNGRLAQPTDVLPPGPDATALQAANNLNRLILDDGNNAQNPDPIVFGRDGAPLSASNTLRGGDTATGVTGVMTYTWAGNSASGNAYRVRPSDASGTFNFSAANPRPEDAPAPAASLRVANLNLLNFFNTFGSSACTQGVNGPATECRGANSLDEFNRQWPKTVAAITKVNADILAVMELENDGYGPESAIQFLVDRLNEATAPGTYAFIDADAGTGQIDALGSDAIKVGLLYKPAVVLPVGQTAALNTVEFVNGGDGAPRNRAALAQAFEELATAGQLVVSANHFKSKGSECDAPDAGDGQGNCNLVRVAAANALTAWLSADPTGTGDEDALILGDLNSYTMEDPIAAIRNAGYASLRPPFSNESHYSYVFDGQWGSLDHGMASLSLLSQVRGAGDYYINADEPSVLDYNTDFKSAGQIASLYAPDEFRISDHNPLIVDLALDAGQQGLAIARGIGRAVIASSGGEKAGIPGSRMSFIFNTGRYPEATDPEGFFDLFFGHIDAASVVHVYHVKVRTISELIVDHAQRRATLVAPAIIEELFASPQPPVVVDAGATLRITMADNGTAPSVPLDTIGVTLWNSAGTLWFASGWDGVKTVEQELDLGEILVR